MIRQHIRNKASEEEEDSEVLVFKILHFAKNKAKLNILQL